MSITAEQVKLLRERTGAGMMECKKALVETGGDLDAAAELMRKQGLAKADKKATRVAAEGVVVTEKSASRWAASWFFVPLTMAVPSRSKPTPSVGTTISIGAPWFFSSTLRMSKDRPTAYSPRGNCSRS